MHHLVGSDYRSNLSGSDKADYWLQVISISGSLKFLKSISGEKHKNTNFKWSLKSYDSLTAGRWKLDPSANGFALMTKLNSLSSR